MRPEHFGAPERAGGGAAAVFDLPVQYTERTGSDATGYLQLRATSCLPLRVEPDARRRPDAGPDRLGRLPARQGQPVRRPHRAAPVRHPREDERMSEDRPLAGLAAALLLSAAPFGAGRGPDHLPQLVVRPRGRRAQRPQEGLRGQGPHLDRHRHPARHRLQREPDQPRHRRQPAQRVPGIQPRLLPRPRRHGPGLPADRLLRAGRLSPTTCRSRWSSRSPSTARS